MGALKAAMILDIWYKFGGILSSNSGINAAQLRTAGVYRRSGY